MNCLRWLPLLLVFIAVDALAAQRLKVGMLAPKGSVFYRATQSIGAEWRKAHEGKARFTIYPSGGQGGERSMVKRMRLGQLHAAMLTVFGLSDIEPSVAALQNIPLAYRSWDEVDHVREASRAELEKRIRAQGFEVLLWAEAGWVHIFSTAPASTPEDFLGRKIFAWGGHSGQVALLNDLGYQAVGLEPTDLLPAFQTGIVEVAPMLTYWAMAGQFQRVAPHMLRLRWAPIVGALVITSKAYERQSEVARDALSRAAREAEAMIRMTREQRDDDAIEQMSERGLHVTDVNDELQRHWQSFVATIYPKLRGNVVPAAELDRVMDLLARYRAR